MAMPRGLVVAAALAPARSTTCYNALPRSFQKGCAVMTIVANRLVFALTTAVALAVAVPVCAETLFKIVTVKDDIVIGLNDAELKDLGGDAGGIAKAIAAKGSLTVWQYAVQQSKDGTGEVAPRQKVGVLANSSLRVEPYKQPFKVLPHE